MSSTSEIGCFLCEVNARLDESKEFSQADARTLFQYCSHLLGELEGIRDTIEMFLEKRRATP